MKVCVMQSRLQVLCIRRHVHPSIHWIRAPLKDVLHSKQMTQNYDLKICGLFQQIQQISTFASATC